MIKFSPLLLVLFAFSTGAFAQPKVYIAPMEGGFDSFLAAALIDNEVPVTITTVEGSASFIITGQAVKGQNHWYDVVFGAERDRNQGSIRLLKVSDRSIVWAGAAGDRSLWWGALKSGGQKKVAGRLARELKKGYFNGKVKITDTNTASDSLLNSTPAIEAQLQASTETQSGFAGKAAGTSKIEIKSAPEGADITVNGSFVGSTPSALVLKSGEHTIIVTKSGYKKWERFIRLEAGSSITLNATLETGQ